MSPGKSQKLISKGEKRAPPKRQSQTNKMDNKTAETKKSPLLILKTNLPQTSNKPFQNYSSDSLSTSKHSENVIESIRKITPKRKASDNVDVSISDEILNHLVMDDSWNDMFSKSGENKLLSPKMSPKVKSPEPLVASHTSSSISSKKPKSKFTFKKKIDASSAKGMVDNSNLKSASQTTPFGDVSLKPNFCVTTTSTPSTVNLNEDIFSIDDDDDDSMLLRACILTESQKSDEGKTI